MPSLTSVYFAAAISGATFFGEYCRSSCHSSSCSQLAYLCVRRVCYSGVHGSLLAVSCSWPFLFLQLTRLHHSSRRERTVTTIVMTVLAVVMFGISAIFFALDISLISDGILHPHKYPRTVVNRLGPETTVQIVCQGINVRHIGRLREHVD
jgi:hypothetical protein